MYKEIAACRMSGSSELVSILDLGVLHLTGVFPRSVEQAVTSGPLELVLCPEGGLLQLRQSYEPQEMYGANYGYRSSLNASMMAHLAAKARKLEAMVDLRPGDVVLDIGSNDATLLKSYSKPRCSYGGIDPSAAKFRDHYPSHIGLVADFFSLDAYRALFGERKARIVTSVAMFYDLESPLEFMRQVAEILEDDGIWHLEQSYMPTMLDALAYDTICHEHLEYYGLAQIKWMADRAGLKLVDVELNDVNGGSFAVTLAHQRSRLRGDTSRVSNLLQSERARHWERPEAYASFVSRVRKHRDELPALIRGLRAQGKTVVGYGASTKGNVVLQYCGLTADDIPCIADVNPDKHGAFTPGTGIPIVSEDEARAMKPDYFLVLPWHFRAHFVEREREFLSKGGGLIFPLPAIEIVR